MFFDLDGVIIDSEPLTTPLVREVLRARDIDLPPETLAGFVGPPLHDSFATVLARAGIADAATEAAVCVTEFRTRYRSCFLDTPAKPSVQPMLEQVALMAPVAVATSKPREFALPILGRLGLADLFAVVAAPEPDWPGDDKVTVLAAALSELEAALGHALSPGRCPMVGDRHHDIDAARALGMPAVGVTWGIGSREELAASAPDAIVDAPEEVAAVVREIIGHRP